jgi:hypothetical protein
MTTHFDAREYGMTDKEISKYLTRGMTEQEAFKYWSYQIPPAEAAVFSKYGIDAMTADFFISGKEK